MNSEELGLSEELGVLTYQPLTGKKIVLGVAGSSSIYKSLDLARRLIRIGAVLRVVMTRFAAKLISPDLFQWATGSKPHVEMTGETEHIDLARWANAMVVAPATLNTMNKIAHGILDELLPLTAVTMLGDGKKVVIVPAMNLRLMNSPQYKKAVELLIEEGVVVIPPLVEEDKAKYPPIMDLTHCIDAVVNRGKDLSGYRVLVTAGSTREYIDPVRVITNPSSGLMGILIAREAACRGAEVTLLHGYIAVQPPYMVKKMKSETTETMAKDVYKLTSEVDFDIAVFAAAPADYRPLKTSEVKIQTKLSPRIIVELEATPKVIKSIAKRPRVLVGFAAETATGDALVELARRKLEDYGLDIVVGNNVLSDIAGFGKEFLDAVILSPQGIINKGILSKYELARIILDHATRLITNR